MLTSELPHTIGLRRDPFHVVGIAFCVLMMGLHVAAGMNSAGLPDFWRDFYWATAIAHGEAFPLAGPQIYQMFELGPWWFWLLALPIRFGANAALTMAFIQCLAALKYPLALRLGTRALGSRFGFACAVSLAIAGWSMASLFFPSHIALVETMLLLLAATTWRCLRRFSAWDAVLHGLVCAGCLHAHPTTLIYIVASGVILLWRHRSWNAVMHLLLAVAIVVMSVLPPLFDRDAITSAALKPLTNYVDEDVGHHALSRVPGLVRGLVTTGAWWSLLLMTPLKPAAAKLAWSILCFCLAFACSGYWLLWRGARALCGIAVLAGVVFLVQVAFVVMLRPVTPIWMVPSCLPPLALVFALGWYGWLMSPSASARPAACVLLGIQVVLVVSPYMFMLRDVGAVRVMPGVNPYFNAGESADDYVMSRVPFYPLRRIDRLAALLCEPQVLHARLAAVIEPTFGAPLRNRCGHWPALRFGGTEGEGGHVAGLLKRAAIASGIEPDRVVAQMALYERVRPIAPAAGGRLQSLRRLQISPDTTSEFSDAVFEFDAQGGDAVVFTNRLSAAAPMRIDAVSVNGHPALAKYDDGGSIVYACAACEPGDAAHWRVALNGIVANLDLVVLQKK